MPYGWLELCMKAQHDLRGNNQQIFLPTTQIEALSLSRHFSATRDCDR